MQKSIGRMVAKFVGLVLLVIVAVAFVQAPGEAADAVGAIFAFIGDAAEAVVTFVKEV